MASTDRKFGYKPHPKLSANQIAEYLTATPGRRRSIIQMARFPTTSAVANYSLAREGIRRFLCDGTRSQINFVDAIDKIEARLRRADPSEWLIKDCRNSKHAIGAFQSAYNKSPMRKLDCQMPAKHSKQLDMFRTKITLDVDVTVHRPRIGEKDQIGGAIMFFVRGVSSSANRIERCKTVAGLIAASFQDSSMGEADPSLCFCVDVFTGTAHKPAGKGIRLLEQVGDAAEEIADRWHTIEPPKDYDGPDFPIRS